MTFALKTPYEYQERVARNKNKGILDLSDTGIGKTISAINYANTREPGVPQFGMLFVSRKQVIKQVEKEVLSLGKAFPIAITRHDKPDIKLIKIWLEQGISVFFISNRHILAHEPTRAYLEKVTKIYKNTFMFVDEAHHYRNLDMVKLDNKWVFKTQSVRYMLEVSKFFEYKYAATRTPYDKSIVEMWPVLHMLYPAKFRSLSSFKDEYLTKDYYTNKWVDKTNAHSDLVERIKHFTYWIKMKDARKAVYGADSPTDLLTTTFVAVEAPQPVKTLVEQMLLAEKKEVTLRIPPRLDGLGNVRPGFTHDFYFPHRFSVWSAISQLTAAHGLKKEWVYEKYPEPTKENSLLVLCRYRTTAIEMAQHYGVTPLLGGVEFTDEIKNNPVIIGTLGYLSESLSLEQVNNLVVVTMNFSSIDYTQILGRINRITSTKPINAYILVSDTMMDDFTQSIVNVKLVGQSRFAKVVDGIAEKRKERDVKKHETVIFNRIQKAVSAFTEKQQTVFVQYTSTENLNIFKNALEKELTAHGGQISYNSRTWKVYGRWHTTTYTFAKTRSTRSFNKRIKID